MAEPEKTRIQAVRDRLRQAAKTIPKVASRTPTTAPRAPTATPQRPPPVRPPPSSVVATQPRGTSLVPSQGRALATPGRAVVPSGGGTPPGPRVPPLNTIGERATNVGSRAARVLGRASGVASAAIPTDIGNAENTPEAAGLQQRFDEFKRLEEQGGFGLNADGTPQTFEQSEEQFAQKQELDRQRAVETGLRGREALPAPGQGFIQNEGTGAVIEFGQGDPTGQRLSQPSAAAPASSSGLRGRSLRSRQTGNAFADIALGFGDATRAAIAEGRGQANRARSQRLRESAIENLPAAQKAARQAEQDRVAANQDADEQFTEISTELSDLDIGSEERQRRLADLDAEARSSPEGGENRILMAEALREIGDSDERGIFDFVKSAFSTGFPPDEFFSLNEMFLDNNIIKQRTGEGKFNDIANIDDLSEISKNTVLRMMADITEAQ